MLLCGCAIFTETYGIQDVDNWAAKNEPLAEAGKMKWSEFYSLYLEKVSATPVINNSPVVERLGINGHRVAVLRSAAASTRPRSIGAGHRAQVSDDRRPRGEPARA